MSAKHAYPDSTNTNIVTQWEFYFMFCFCFNLIPIPTTINIMSLYSQFLSRSFKSVDSIRNYISGVKLLHLFLDKEYPQFDSFHLKLVLKGLSRTKPHCPKQAQPINPKLLCDMFEIFNHKNSYDATFWCLFIHAFFLMFRKSNLVPDSVRSFNGVKQLCRKNFTFDKDSGILLVKIKWSKAIQFGERELAIPLLPIPDSPLCPVQAYLNMISLVGVSQDSPAFSILKGKKTQPVMYRQFQSVLKQTITLLGKHSDDYSTHSFRRGGATWAFFC
jgi:hypothetical protein